MNFVEAIGNYHTNSKHGLTLKELKDCRKRCEDVWIPEVLVMDDALNHRINNMIYNNQMFIDCEVDLVAHIPVNYNQSRS